MNIRKHHIIRNSPVDIIIDTRYMRVIHISAKHMYMRVQQLLCTVQCHGSLLCKAAKAFATTPSSEGDRCASNNCSVRKHN